MTAPTPVPRANSGNRPADDLRLFLVEDEGILFDPVGQRLFHLNAAAACIWCHLEEGLPMGAVVDRAARSMQLEQRLARRYVRKMVRRWRDLGLLRAVQARRSFERRGRKRSMRSRGGATTACSARISASASPMS